LEHIENIYRRLHPTSAKRSFIQQFNGAAMAMLGRRWISFAIVVSALLASRGSGLADPPPPGQSRFEAALANITSLERPDQDGLATIWDGNKYVQVGACPTAPCIARRLAR
jgi:hypothetical protein